MPATTAPGGRERFAAAVRAELPAFLASVDAFAIPPELQKGRFGVTEWHHPDILALLESGDPIRPFAEVLESWIASWEATTEMRELPAVELFDELSEFCGGNLNRNKISSGPSQMGHQLARLARTEGWRARIVRAERRIRGRQNQKQTVWQIVANPGP